jgi:hypothetical protein
MLLRDGRAPPQGELRSEERAKGPSDAQRRWHVGGMYLHAFRRHHRQAGGRPSRTVPVRPGQAKLACLGASVPSRARRGGGRARRRLPSALLAIAPAPTPSTPSTFTLTLTSLPPPRHSRCRPAPSNTPGSALPCAGARPSRAVPPLRLIGLPPRSRIARALLESQCSKSNPSAAPPSLVSARILRQNTPSYQCSRRCMRIP